MKKIQLKLEKIYAIEVDDNVKLDDFVAIYAKLEDDITSNNNTISNEFWENITIVCSDCGISLNLDEEKEDGICASCSGQKDTKISKEDVLNVAKRTNTVLTEDEIKKILKMYSSEQKQDSTATWDLVIDHCIQTVKEKPLIKQIGELLNKKSFACVSQGHGGQMGYVFINKKTFEYLGIQEEDLDDEDFWNILGTTEKEIKDKLEDRNKTEEKYTEDDLNKKINDRDEDYQAVIKEFIVANEEVVGGN